MESKNVTLQVKIDHSVFLSQIMTKHIITGLKKDMMEHIWYIWIPILHSNIQEPGQIT
jgi:hypothetical protein